jgi:imidazolonepropionase
MRRLLTDLDLCAMPEGGGTGHLRRAAILVTGGRIAWAGPEGEAPGADRVERLGGRLVTPALIDCHTHVVHGGSRAREFALRLEGASYAEIARAGGGILSTVEATRVAGEDALLAAALPRVDAMLAGGTGTVEVKSGYGLDVETELAMLRAARRIAEARPVRVVTSFLGAHAVPPDWAGDPDGYLEEVCLPALRAAHADGLVDAVDGFCEGIAFDAGQIARVFDAAARLGLPVKLHAEQLSQTGGTALLAARAGLSADHVEYATETDAAALARAGSVAVLLPGAFHTLRETQAPPIAAFRAHGVPMAVATDCNPGSSPMTSLPLAMNMACTFFRLTPDEALLGATRHAARALGIEAGRIAPGLPADLAVWDVADPAEIAYRIGDAPLHARMHGGDWA